MKSVFLADDDPDDRLFFADALKQTSAMADLTVSKDGIELMDRLATVTNPPPPDVIFLDLNMPRKNGFDCLKEIRANPRLKNIPVVIVSTSSNQDMVDRTYADGANYYLCKPRSFSQLVRMIERVFGFDLWSNQRPSKEKFLLATA
jgi:CheY-like chemotaxis protein